eukprot:CAMPEP_0174273518 /NCGR_PEP_ID=MMETSP0439-20130205/54784_1 /TAXON_ID=0 /ORGANISM="Stereomyxa ramosa, Strain Chinc5" /LENGTH=307 /DNA_ID=CAMNT_0015364719 /DNA_START=209 /DNA_END=1129 /DNA_ORIENTATION=+
MLDKVDESLGGGIPSGSITEVVGPFGVGKTQLCLQLAMVTALPTEYGGLDSSVIYIDTEKAFNPNRLVGIVSARHPDFEKEENLERLLIPFTKRVIVLNNINNLNHMIDLTREIEEMVVVENVKLIIIDSVAFRARRDYGEGEIVIRQKTLSTLASRLKTIAEVLNVSVVSTNQVTSGTASQDIKYSFDATLPSPFYKMEKQHTTAALGTLWSHAVNSRIILDFHPALDYQQPQLDNQQLEDNYVRVMTIAKCASAPVISFPYFINSAALNLADLSTAPYLHEQIQCKGNFFNRSIASKPDVAPGIK